MPGIAGTRSMPWHDGRMAPPPNTDPRRPARRRAGALVAALLAAPALPARAQAESRTVRTALATLEVAEFARGLQHPWGLAFLPEGRMLVTERPGRLRLVEPDGRLSAPLAGVPTVLAQGQGGLLGVVLSPAFATDRTLFLSYAERTPAGGRTAVARAEFDGSALREVRTIFRQQPDASGGNHWGGQMVFDRDGLLFVTLGDRFSLRDKAQDLGTHLGKIVRIRPDGSVPPDNPFVGRAGALPEIWSYGHRNVQGAALHPSTGRLWTHEHGPQGGDELNVVLAGRNHGWPIVTFGREYGTGFRIGEGTEKAGMVPPLLQWTPSIAPSGMAFYGADRIPGWKGQLLVGALAYRSLYRIELDGERVVAQERMLEGIGRRIRDVRVGPDGLVYLLTDEPEGAILRLNAR
jgi:glucose/arabinose dehydrogenase